MVFKAKRRTVVTTAAAVVVLLFAALVVTVFTHGNSSSASDDNLVAYPAGHRPAAPEFTARSLTGAPINFASYRGKIVVLNVWASWCAPCRSEGQTLKYLDEEYGPQGIAFLGDDLQDTPANALPFLRSEGITYPSVNDASGAVEERLAIAVPISATPTTLVIDKTGHVAGVIEGAVTYPEMTTLLKDAAVTQ
ncbi:MAG TPA: TlpA disulfide reductase family protein [Trebonia sp.]|nr:TlpA disulfide reductase family protein [Trebonia sp.]